MSARRRTGVQCGFGRAWGDETAAVGLRVLLVPSRYPRVLRCGLRIVVALLEAGERGEGNAKS